MIVSDTTSAPRGTSLLRAILAHGKFAIIVPSCAGVGLGYLGYLHTPARYNAEAVLVLDARHIQALPTASVVSPLPQDSPVLRSELDIISSQLMASKVLQRLGPVKTAFLRNDDKEPLSAMLLGSVRNLLAERATAASGAQIEAPKSSDEILQGQLLSNLRVVNDGRSYTIFVSYTAGDPKLAAAVANAFADSYLDYQVEIQGAGTRQVSAWIGNKLVNLRTTLENSERALNAFRTEANLVDPAGTAPQVQRVTDAETQLQAAETEMERSQTRLAAAKRQLKENGQLAMTDVGSIPIFETLRSERYQIERKIAELTGTGAKLSKDLPGLRSQLAAIAQQWDEANRRVVDGFAEDVEIVEQRHAAAQDNLDDARRELDAANKALVQGAQLEREATANRVIYESYLARYKETIEQEGIAAPDAVIISRAQPLQGRSSPQLRNWLTLGLALGGLLGVLTAVLRQLTNKRVRTADELAEYTGHPVLGVIPSFTIGKTVTPRQRKSRARLAAALEATVATIHLTPRGRNARVIAITSRDNAEGKTTVTAELARSMAASGTAVLAIDFNFARTGLARKFSQDPVREEEAYPMGRQDIDARIVTYASGVAVMTAYMQHSDQAPPLSSKDFRTALTKLRERFEVILIDSPALSQTLDAWQVAAMAEGVIMIVDRSSSRIDNIKASLDRLDEYGCCVLGSVINRLSARSTFPHPLPPAVIQEDGRKAESRGRVYDFPETVQSI